MQKSADAFRTISEVADDLSLPQHVLRFWETRFPQIRPLKRAGGRRYYRPADVLLLKTIQQLLYDDGYTIKGVQRLLKEQGAKGLTAGVPPADFDWTEPVEVDAQQEGLGPSPGIGPDTGFVQERSNRDVMGQERPGQERPGQERPGQERPGQERPGQERPGQERPGQERPNRDAPSTRFRGRRDVVEDALETIDECRRILDALCRPSR